MNAVKECCPQKERLVGFNKLVEPLERHMEALDALLEVQAEEFEEEIRDLVSYTLTHRGKRIRPILVFYSGWRGDRDVDDGLVRVAAVMELIHLATLVHDDILDEATLRHNSSTVNIKFGKKQAILLGDALFSHAFKLATEFETVEVCRVVSEGVRKVCSGEIGQTLRSGDAHFSYDDYFRTIDLKTAELFYVSCYLGGRLSGHPDDYVKAVGTFGRNLGMAYQIYDDLADIVGDEQRIGKTLGTDLARGNYTLPMLLLLDKLEPEKRLSLMEEMRHDPSRALRVREMMEAHRVFEEVKVIFNEKIAEARRALGCYSGSAAVSYLFGIKELICAQMETLRGA